MKKSASHKLLYSKTPSEIVAPIGHTSVFTKFGSSSYLTVKQKGLDLQKLYQDNNLQIKQNSFLYKLIEDVSILSNGWLCNDTSQATVLRVFSAIQLDRIATAALPLGVSNRARKYLVELLSGSLDLLNRDRSKAKDTLWELELWQLFTRMNMQVSLEEPDIVVFFNGARIGISCKKIYSINNVEKVISKAVSQFEKEFDFGVIAINLDDIIPANCILAMDSKQKIIDVIFKINLEFMYQNDRYLRKYLSTGRAISAIFSASVLADVPTIETRFFSIRQSTFWTIPGLPLEKELQINNFFNAVNLAHT